MSENAVVQNKIERVSTSEAAKMLGLCNESVRRLHRSGLLRARLFPKGLMYEKAQVEKLAINGRDPVCAKKMMNAILSIHQEPSKQN